MAAIANDIDRILQAAPTRYPPATDRALRLVASAEKFRVTANGVATPGAITFTPEMLGMSGQVTYTKTGISVLSIDGNVATLAYAAMTEMTATVRASITVDNVTYASEVTIEKDVDAANLVTRRAYAKSRLATLSAAPATLTTTGDSSYPPANSWGSASDNGGAGTVWVGLPVEVSAGEIEYETVGVFNSALGATIWSAPVRRSLKVKNLAAQSAETGDLTFTGKVGSANGHIELNADGSSRFRKITIETETGEVVLRSGATLAEQTPMNPNLCARIRSWATGTMYNASTGLALSDSRFGGGEYLSIGTAGGYNGAESNALNINANDWFTVSYEAWCASGTRVLNVDAFGGGVDSAGKSVAVTTTPARYTFTEQMPNVATAAEARLRVWAAQGGSDITVTKIKVEMGAKATGWCDNFITPSNVHRMVGPGAIGNTQIGGDLLSSNWEWDNTTFGAKNGWLIQRSGRIYAKDVKLSGATMGGAFVGYVWPAAGNGYYLGPEGLLLGNKNNGSWIAIGSGGTVESKNWNVDASGQVTVNGPIITNPTFDSFTATISGNLLTTVANGLQTYGNLSVTANGSFKTPLTIQWSCGFETANGTAGSYSLSGDTASNSVSVKGSATNEKIFGSVYVQITDANGRVALAARGHQPVHGSFVAK